MILFNLHCSEIDFAKIYYSTLAAHRRLRIAMKRTIMIDNLLILIAYYFQYINVKNIVIFLISLNFFIKLHIIIITKTSSM